MDKLWTNYGQIIIITSKCDTVWMLQIWQTFCFYNDSFEWRFESVRFDYISNSMNTEWIHNDKGSIIILGSLFFTSSLTVWLKNRLKCPQDRCTDFQNQIPNNQHRTTNNICTCSTDWKTCTKLKHSNTDETKSSDKLRKLLSTRMKHFDKLVLAKT